MRQTIRPRSLGELTNPERRRDGAAFMVSALGLVDLASPDDAMSEQSMWSMVAQELPHGQMLDGAMPKPRAEVLIAGSLVPLRNVTRLDDGCRAP
jgi:hypothetical protein